MRKKVSIILSLLLVFLLLTACGGSSGNSGNSSSSAESEQKTEEPAEETEESTAEETPAAETGTDRILNLCANAAYEHMNPLESNNLNSKDVWAQVYEALIYFNYETSEVEPRIAESYSSSEDGLTWTFNLRDGVKFHNGETLTTEDVLYSFDLAMNAPLFATYVAGIKDVAAPDDKTIVITLESPSAVFLQNIAEIIIFNKAFNEANDLATSGCGTGPFKFESIDLTTKIELSRFDDYYRGPASIAGIVFNVITDSAAQAMALESGGLDFLGIAHSQYEDFNGKDGFEVGQAPTFHTVWVTFNCEEGPFSDVRVRKAFSYLIDRKAICIACFEGMAEVDSLLLNPNIQGMPDRSVLKQYEYDYDPEKGLALLEEAGYDTSKEIDLGTLYSYAEGHYITKACPVIQANLAQYNIKIQIDAGDTNAFVTALYNGELPIGMSGGSYGADMSNYYQVYGSYNYKVFGGNPFCYKNPELDKAFEDGALELDMTKRQAIYENVMKILYDDCIGTGVGHKYNVFAWTDELKPVLSSNSYHVYDWSFTA